MPNGKPNILVLWGDDIGWWNISYNSRGQMGYRTPNIDRIGYEGAAFIYADHPARFGEATEALVVAAVHELVPGNFLASAGRKQAPAARR